MSYYRFFRPDEWNGIPSLAHNQRIVGSTPTPGPTQNFVKQTTLEVVRGLLPIGAAFAFMACTPTVYWQSRVDKFGDTCTVWRANDRLHASIAWVSCRDKNGERFDPYPTEESSIFTPIFDALSGL